MNKRFIFLTGTILLLVSCQREKDMPDHFKAPDITAEIQTETRTVLSVDENGTGTIYWKPADQIDVFIGGEKLVYTSQNTSNAVTAVFKTDYDMAYSHPDSDPLLAIYPSNYNSYYSYDGSVVATLPSVQYGLPGTFDDDLFMAVATGTRQMLGSSTPLSFHNVCSGLKFSLSRDDITCVRLMGTNYSDGRQAGLAGDVWFDTDGTCSSGSETEIFLYPKNGSTFQKDTYYYIVCLPASLNDFYVRFDTVSGDYATLRGSDYNRARYYELIDGPFEFRPSVFMRKTHIDEYAQFNGEDVPHTKILYWTTGNPSVIWQKYPDGVPYLECFGAEPYDNQYVYDSEGGYGYLYFTSPVTRLSLPLFEGGNLTKIYLPNSITEIGDLAFEGCNSLSYLSIPQSLVTIGDNAFSDCWSLSTMVLSNSVTSIGSFAFSFCTRLTSFVLPASVTSMGYNPLAGCRGLTSIVVDSANPVYDSGNNCNAIINSSTGELISGCINTTIPTSVTRIGDDAFSSCYGLTSISIPNSVTSIGNYAFHLCYGLQSLDIPASITSIGSEAFIGCTGLQSIVVHATWPPSIGSFAFDETNGCPIYVPEESVSVYKSYWSAYADRIQAIPSSTASSFVVTAQPLVIQLTSERCLYQAPLSLTMEIRDDNGNYVLHDGFWTLGNGMNGIPAEMRANDFYEIALSFVYDMTSLPSSLRERASFDYVPDDFDVYHEMFTFDYREYDDSSEPINGTYSIPLMWSINSSLGTYRCSTQVIIRGEDQL